MTSKLFIDEIPDNVFDGKRIILRVDYNVPLDLKKPELEDLSELITDDARITATFDTLFYLLDRNVKSVVILSHMGRPNGVVASSLSLQPVSEHLSTLINRPVTYIDDCADAERVHAAIEQGGIILLENLRFYAEEESDDFESEAVVAFRSTLTSYGDIYINDAFATCHRPHSSLVGIGLPLKAAGFLLKRELQFFSAALETPSRPSLLILGGGKLNTKMGLITNLLNVVDEIIVAGGMPFTFKVVLNQMEIGKSLFDESGAELVPTIMQQAAAKGVTIHLPTDYVCGDSFSPEASVQICTDETGIPPNWMGLDIGEESVEFWCNEVIPKAKTIIWNGPPGVWEFEKFRNCSVRMMETIVGMEGVVSIICGGDTGAMVKNLSEPERVSHVSTGGGASLELCEGKQLPGVAALSDKQVF